MRIVVSQDYQVKTISYQYHSNDENEDPPREPVENQDHAPQERDQEKNIERTTTRQEDRESRDAQQDSNDATDSPPQLDSLPTIVDFLISP